MADRIPLVLTYRPALNSVGKTVRDFHSVLSNLEERRMVFPEPPVTAFQRCKNLKDILVRAESRCQVCVSIDNCDSFHSHVTKKEYKINFAFKFDLSNVVYLFHCVVYGFQYVGSTSTPFRYRINYKACYRKFSSGSSVPQMDLFRHFSEENHHFFWKIFVLRH